MEYRLITIFRGGLVSLIFQKTLSLDSTSIEDQAPVTLMSTDMDGISQAMGSLHDTWAAVPELGIGIYLLYRQVGVSCFWILIPAIGKKGPVCAVSWYSRNYPVSTLVSTKFSAGMGPAGVAWNMGVQKRVAVTSSMLSQIKRIKMMGLTEYVCDTVQGLRELELKLSIKFQVAHHVARYHWLVP
jgi:ATP-binding cassette, subfamily C (CFTR/MRP), member 1